MCVNCQTNQQNAEKSASSRLSLDAVDSSGFNPPNDHHLKTADLYRDAELPERFKNTGNFFSKNRC